MIQYITQKTTEDIDHAVLKIDHRLIYINIRYIYSF